MNKDCDFKIHQYRILKYKPYGTLSASKTYCSLYNPFRYAKVLPLEITLQPLPRVTIKQAKMKDVRDLFQYLKEESINFYELLFGYSTHVGNDNESSAEESDEDEL